MRSDQFICLAGCETEAYEVLRNALNRVGFRVARTELNEIITSDPKPDCIVFYLTSDNRSDVQIFLSQSALLNAKRIAIVDARDKDVSSIPDSLEIHVILYKPVQMSRLVSAIDRVLGNPEMPPEPDDIPDNSDICDDDMELDDEAADKAQEAWAIAQYQKRHGQELPPDEWKQMMLARLKEDKASHNKRIMRVLGIAILLFFLAIIVLILFKMNRTMDAQIHEQLIQRHHR